MRLHWFLPETPDVLGTLATQADVTVRGLTAFAAWSAAPPTRGRWSGPPNTRRTGSAGPCRPSCGRR